MTAQDSFIEHWYFHFPNLILAALIYTLIGRYLLELLFRKNQQAVILVVFRRVTDPVIRAVRSVTPLAVPNGLVIVFSIVWLLGLRLFLLLTFLAAGVRPISMGG